MNSEAEPAVSTNSDLYVVPIAGGEAEENHRNPGADNSPAYSPDGKYLAWRTQLRAGYESDRWRLVVMERASGKLTSLTEGLDRWVRLHLVAGFRASFFTVEDRGRQGVQMVAATGGGARAIIPASSTIDEMQFTPDGKTLVYTEQTGSRPARSIPPQSGGAAAQLTRFNDAGLSDLQLPELEEFWVEGAEQARGPQLPAQAARLPRGQEGIRCCS